MVETALEAIQPVREAEQTASAVEWQITSESESMDLATLDGCSCGCACGCGCGGISV